VHPLTTSAWFERVASEVLALIEQAERYIGERTQEFVSTMIDLQILAHLALYHARRAHAGFRWSLFQHAQDLHALDEAIAHEEQAIAAWSRIVAAAGDAYADDLMMGLERAGLSGHWRDELAALQDGLQELRERRARFRPPQSQEGPQIAHVPVRVVAPGQDLVIRATVSSNEPIARVQVGYAHTAGNSTYTKLERSEPFLYRATIPGAAVRPGLRYAIKAIDGAGQRATFPQEGHAHTIAVIVTDDDAPPTVIHTPIATAPAGVPLTVTSTVRDPSGVQWVRLRYRSVTQFQEFRSLEMRPTGRSDEYQATVPGEHVDPGWDFMYLIEAMDNCGNGRIYPDLEVETPYVVVQLKR
jgi:hypothetical protein